MSKNTADKQDDIAVTWDGISKLFSPPKSRPTIHRWLKDGKIAPVKGISGYYLLNKTRVRLGLPPVDTKEYRESNEPSSLSPTELTARGALQLVFLNLDEQLGDALGEPEPLPEILTEKDMALVRGFTKAHHDNFMGLETFKERIAYARGALDAIYLDDEKNRKAHGID